MKVISVGTDRNIFSQESAVKARVIEYGGLFDELHIVVFSRRALGFRRVQIARNVWAYPTNSRFRMSYVRDALKLCESILQERKMSSRDTVITCQDPFETGLVGSRIKDRYGIPLHIQIHTDFLSPFFSRKSLLNKSRVRIAKKILSHADAIRAVSQRIADSIVHAGWATKTPAILPIFVDKKNIERASITTDLKTKYPQFKFIILMASRLTKEKNIPLALRAMKEIITHYPYTGLVIVGSGPCEEQIKAEAKSLKITQNLVLEPWNNDLISYYKTANLFLVTSDYEGYGMTIVEATAARCPAISTDVGIASQVLKDGQSFICAVGDVACITQKIKTMLESNQARETFVRESVSRLALVTCSSKKEYLEKYKASIEAAQTLMGN